MEIKSAFKVQFLDSVSSTNVFLRESPQGCYPYHAAVSTDQSAGRGRLNRTWESAPGLGLAVSASLPLLTGNQAVGINSLAVGSALLEFIREKGVGQAELKWPNDILVGGRKLAGVLCEVTSSEVFVAGIGVNLFHRPYELPTSNSTSLFIEGVRVESTRDFVLELLTSLGNFWSSAISGTTDLLDKVAANVGSIGRRVHVREIEGHSWEGVAESIDLSGRLQVRRQKDARLVGISDADVQHLRHR